MRSPIFLTFTLLGMMLGALAASADEYKPQGVPGFQARVTTYCLDPDHMDRLADLLDAEDKSGYLAYINDHSVRCYDSRMHRVRLPPFVILQDFIRMVDVHNEAGKLLTFEVWAVTAPNGDVAWAFIPMTPVEPEGTDA